MKEFKAQKGRKESKDTTLSLSMMSNLYMNSPEETD